MLLQGGEKVNNTILVAGAGHGGLCAAYHLAKAGFNVTVFESKKREDLGYDWPDFIDTVTFSDADLPSPDFKTNKYYGTAFFGCGKDVKLVKTFERNNPRLSAERKDVLNFLIEAAENAGVKFVFEANVNRALTKEDKVIGLEIDENGQTNCLFCNLVIDAAGVNSPVRKSLPEKFGILRNIDEKDMFCAYRAIYEKKSDFVASPKYSIYFYHRARKGMDWIITEDDCVDILVGKIGQLSQKEIDDALEDFKKDYGCLSDNLIRGGQICAIPLRKALEKFVCTGYAAVGDSAAMTEPLCGSGMNMSICAGNILAKVIISANKDVFSKSNLERYEKRYYEEIGQYRVFSDACKNFLLSLGSEKFDKTLRRKVLTEKDFGGGKYTFKETVKRVFGVLSMPSILPDMIRLLREMK